MNGVVGFHKITWEVKEEWKGAKEKSVGVKESDRVAKKSSSGFKLYNKGFLFGNEDAMVGTSSTNLNEQRKIKMDSNSSKLRNGNRKLIDGAILYSFSIVFSYLFSTESAQLSEMSFSEVSISLLLMMPVVITLLYGRHYFQRQLGYLLSGGIALTGSVAGFWIQNL